MNSPDERWLWLAADISEIQDQRKISIMNGNPGNIDDARDALLEIVSTWQLQWHWGL